MNETGKISVNSDNLMPIIKKWLYSDRDIFVRELISNGVDAVSKLKKLASMGEASVAEDEAWRVDVACDKEAGTITFTDNGLGMTKEEVEKYINQVAFSGAADFMAKYEAEGDSNDGIIGHFGLGFYSAFMVADKVTIDTVSYREGAVPVHWESDGSDEYTISDSERTARGTAITLFLNEESKEFADSDTVHGIIEKYCAFMPVDIYLAGVHEDKPLNETSPLWLKKPSDCTEEEYKAFYHKVFTDFNDPLFWIHLNVDYPFHLKGILFFPKLTEHIDSVQGQIKLYNNQVFVADNIKEIIPEFLLLLKGVIDCPDMPLNVSRSFLQNDRTVQQISNHITKKVADRLTDMAEKERETYEKYWADINVFVKFGCMRDAKFSDRMKNHVIFKSTAGGFVTLEDYLKTAEDKKVFYTASEDAQAQYIAMLKEAGKDAIVMDGMLDIPFMQYLEMQNPGVKFARVDAELSGTEDKDGDGYEELCRYAKDALGQEELTVKAGKLNGSLPAVLLVDEFGRRMKEAQKYYGMDFPDSALKYTLVLNSGSKLTEKLKAMPDGEAKLEAVSQVFDLARLAQGSMKPDEVTAFLTRSADILEKTL